MPAKRGGNGDSKKPPGGGGGGGETATSVGLPWTQSGVARDAVGKIFFRMGSTRYVCSGAVVQDSAYARSMVLTAGHCVFDESAGVFASDVMFYPDYAAHPVDDCQNAPSGCWVASGLAVHEDYASAGGFNGQAVTSDWGFAIFDHHATHGHLDQQVQPWGITFGSQRAPMYSFGYPAAPPYDGDHLIYCNGDISADKRMARLTWGMRCTMTGGSSGGPWLKNFNATTQIGQLNSVNSYKYNGKPDWMYGPKFNDRTRLTYDTARAFGDNDSVRVKYDWDTGAR